MLGTILNSEIVNKKHKSMKMEQEMDQEKDASC